MASAAQKDAGEVVVTGAGLITTVADSLPGFAEALLQGRRSIRAAAELDGRGQALIDDFDATKYVNVRGMRVYSRTTRLGLSAARLALADANLDPASVAGPDLGIVVGTTFGHMETLVDYDRSLVTEGLQRTNPALMPLGLPSAPGAAIALSFGAKAFSVTLADGAVSGLDAIAAGARLLADGRARVCVVVGTFSPFPELSLSAHRAGLLASPDDFHVLDRRHAGTVFGEAAGALVLERLEDARARQASWRGQFCGQASTFASNPTGGQDRSEQGMRRALRRACDQAFSASGVGPSAIRVVSLGAAGRPALDDAEAGGVLDALGPQSAQIPVLAVKASVGECVDAGGVLQTIAALAVLEGRQAPPLSGWQSPALPGLRYLGAAAAVERGHALVTAISPTGACSALVMKGSPEPHGA